jgi:hypothetical protein
MIYDRTLVLYNQPFYSKIKIQRYHPINVSFRISVRIPSIWLGPATLISGWVPIVGLKAEFSLVSVNLKLPDRSASPSFIRLYLIHSHPASFPPSIKRYHPIYGVVHFPVTPEGQRLWKWWCQFVNSYAHTRTTHTHTRTHTHANTAASANDSE